MTDKQAQAVADLKRVAPQDLAWRKAGGPQRVRSRPPADSRGAIVRISQFRGELAKTRWERA